MAEWRERGYVPDSDDEEASSDILTEVSRSTKTLEAFPQRDAGSVADSVLADLQGREIEQKRIPNVTRAVEPENVALDLRQPLAQSQSTGRHLESAPDRNFLPSGDVSDSTGCSTAEKLQAELQHGIQTVQDVLDGFDEGRPNGFPDRSTSSSPLSSLVSIESISLSTASPQTHNSSHFLAILETGNNNDIPDTASRRSLRQRNPIQIHPYALEDARYQQQWRSRGLRPIHNPHVHSNGSDVVEEEESQEQDSFRSSQLRNPSPGALSLENDQIPGFEGRVQRLKLHDLEAEDLPEISELLQDDTLYDTRKRVRKARQLEGSSNHGSGPGQYHVYDLPRGINGGGNVASLDVPPSPPLSGSSASVPISLRETKSRSHPRGSTPRTLLTPVLSSDAQRKRSIVEVSSSSEASPSAEKESSSTSENDTNEISHLAGLHSMQRRIKGVLPASWLKLDLKRQTTTKERRAGVQSPVRHDGKGVAQRVVSAQGQQMRSNSSLFWDSDSSDIEMLDSDSFHRPIQSPTRVSWEETNNYFRASWADEVIEDNRVDPMPPTRPRQTSSKLKKRIHRQKRPSTTRKRLEDLPGDLEPTSHSWRTLNARRPNVPQAEIQKRKRLKTQPRITQLSILDAPGFQEISPSSQPHFLRVAGRTSHRSNVGQDSLSQDPSRKIFKLASTKDTKDVNETLNDWQAGKLSRRGTGYHSALSVGGKRPRPEPFTRPQGQTSMLPNDSRSARMSLLANLKRSTESTLLKLKKPHPQFPSLTSADQSAHSLADGKSLLSSKPGPFLNPLRPYVNRSGQGHLDAASHPPRLAQLEGPPKYSSKPRLHFRNAGAIRPLHLHDPTLLTTPPTDHVPWSNDFEGNGVALPVSSEVAQSALKRCTQPFNHVPRKLPPIKIATSDEDEEENPPTWQSTASMREDGLLLQARNMLNNIARLTPGTKYCGQSFIGRGRVDRAIMLLNKGRDLSMASVDPLQSPFNKTNSPFGSSEPGASKTLFSMLEEILNQWHRLLELRQQSEEHRNLFNSLIDGCCSLFDNYIECANNGLWFPTKSDAALFVRKTLVSINDILVGAATAFQTSHPSTALRAHHLLNRVCVVSFQIVAIAQIQNLSQEQIEEALIAYEEIARRCLAFSLRAAAKERLVSFIQQNHASTRTEPEVPNAPEIDSIVILQNFYKKLYGDTWTVRFSQAICSVFQSMRTENALENLAEIVIAVSCILPLTQVSSTGVGQGQRDSGLPFSGWPTIVPAIDSCLKQYLNVRGQRASIIRDFVFQVLQWCLNLCTSWDWTDPDSLAKILVRFYNINGMQECFHRTGRSANALSTFVTAPMGQSFILAQEDSDFDICLKLIGLSLAQKVRSREKADPKFADRLRSFVFSLCPNNGRLLRGDEDLLESDLAALVNRCGLYITLWKHAPEGCKPRISQIQNLAPLSESHVSVWFLILETWTILTRHSLHFDSALDGLVGLSQWLLDLVRQMCARHVEAREEILSQMNHLNIRDEEQGRRVIDANQASIAKYLVHVFGQWTSCLRDCQTLYQLQVLMGSEHWSLILAPCRNSLVLGDHVSLAVLGLCRGYFSKMKEFLLSSSDMAMLQDHIKKVLIDRYDTWQTQTETTLALTTMAWFDLASLSVHARLKSWDDYLDPHGTLSTENLLGKEAARQCKVLFLACALEHDSLLYQNSKLETLAFMLRCLAQPINNLKFEHRLATAIFAIEGSNATDTWGFVEPPYREMSSDDLRVQRSEFVTEVIQRLMKAANAGLLPVSGLKTLIQAFLNAIKTTFAEIPENTPEHIEYRDFIVRVLTKIEAHNQSSFHIDRWFYETDCFTKRSGPGTTVLQTFNENPSQRITKDTVDGLHLLSVDTAIQGTQYNLVNELQTLFSAVDRLPEDVLPVQLDFIQSVLTAYIELALTPPGHLLAFPILEAFVSGGDLLYRPLNEHRRHSQIWLAECCFGLVATTRKCLQSCDPKEIQMHSYLWPILTLIVRLAHHAILQYEKIKHATKSKRVHGLYKQMRANATYIARYLSCIDPGHPIDKDDGITFGTFQTDFGIFLRQKSPSELQHYSRDSLESLLHAGNWQFSGGLETWEVRNGRGVGKVVRVTQGPEDESWRLLSDEIHWFTKQTYRFLFGLDVIDHALQGDILEGRRLEVSWRDTV